MSKLFDIKKYNNVTTDKQFAQDLFSPYIEATDALGNKGFVIGFKHVPTGKRVQFKAFITTFNETYASDWASETVFGRGDPIYTFKNTTRTLSLGWLIPAASVSEGYDNLHRLQQFIQFLYPTYTNVQGAQTINQSPLVRIELMNMLRSRTDPAGDGWNKYRNAKFDSADGEFSNWSQNAQSAINGLLGVISNVSIAHNLDNPDIGVFERGIAAPTEGQNGAMSSARILPKMIEVQIDFSVIHEHPVGWQDKSFGSAAHEGMNFPYGINPAIAEPLSGEANVNEGQSPSDPSTTPGPDDDLPIGDEGDLTPEEPDEISGGGAQVHAAAAEGVAIMGNRLVREEGESDEAFEQRLRNLAEASGRQLQEATSDDIATIDMINADIRSALGGT
jgi:hypothetical protein